MNTALASQAEAPALDAPARCPIVELRQYTLYSGRRDELIALFDREFIETQESVGITVLGQYRDLGDADRFVWLRGFASMAARARALESFYEGPAWKAHRNAANATMIDSDDVLLLRPANERCDMPIEQWQREAPTPVAGALLAVVCELTAAPSERFAEILSLAMAPTLARSGGTLAACYLSEASPNNFPRLPVREGKQVVVWLARFEHADACKRLAAQLMSSDRWIEQIATDGPMRLGRPLQVLRLAPTARSRF